MESAAVETAFNIEGKRIWDTGTEDVCVSQTRHNTSSRDSGDCGGAFRFIVLLSAILIHQYVVDLHRHTPWQFDRKSHVLGVQRIVNGGYALRWQIFALVKNVVSG